MSPRCASWPMTRSRPPRPSPYRRPAGCPRGRMPAGGKPWCVSPTHVLGDAEAAGPASPGLLASLGEPVTQVLLAPPPPGLLAPGLRGDGPPPIDGSAAALRDGLARGEIGVHYQPVVRLADRRPVMVEALARWHRPGSPVSPDTFIPLAE